MISTSPEVRSRVEELIGRARRARNKKRLAAEAGEFEASLQQLRSEYRAAREQEIADGDPVRVGIGGWNLSQNPAGRAVTLAEAHRTQTPAVDMLGWVHGKREIWGPLREYDIPIHYERLDRDAHFLRTAIELTLAHPYDVLHLSKPRIHNIVLGRLAELFWGTRVIVDVDDEELSFVGGRDALTLESAVAKSGGTLPQPEDPNSPFWTRVGVGQVETFHTVTVSNPALQGRYGGTVVPHVRDENSFAPTPERKAAARRRWGIPEDKKVVLFFGTPRRHKGLLETAYALNELNRDDVVYVVAGDFPKKALDVKEELEQMEGLRCQFIPGQPYSSIPDVVSLGDITVLPQDPKSKVARYQLPAKLMDALAMNVVALIGVTPATQWLADAGAVVPIEEDLLPGQLSDFLNTPHKAEAQRQRGRQVFEEQLSVRSIAPEFRRLHRERSHPSRSWEGQLVPMLQQGRIDPLLGQRDYA